MPSAILHLSHVELLAKDPALPKELRAAILSEMSFARLGAVFFDLPFYTNIVTMMLGYWLEMPAETCPFAQKLHRFNPEKFAWHVLQKISEEGWLNTNQRLAFLCGFFSHIALDREIHPLVNWCARRDVILFGGNESHQHRLAEKYQSLFFHRERFGHDVLGFPPVFLEKTRIVDHHAFFRRAVEPVVIRWATDLLRDFFFEAAPSKRVFAGWIRSFRHFGLMISLPMAATNSRRLGNQRNKELYFENSDFSFMDYWNRAYEKSLELITMAFAVAHDKDFSPDRRIKFLKAARITDLAYPPEDNLPALHEPYDLKLEPGLA